MVTKQQMCLPADICQLVNMRNIKCMPLCFRPRNLVSSDHKAWFLVIQQ